MKAFFCLILLAAGFALGKIPFAKCWKENAKPPTPLIDRLFAIKEHKPFVVIVPSYNNSEWVERNLRSIFEQKYDNFRVIYIDDASTDGTGSEARRIASAYKQEHRIQIWRNASNRGAVENIYTAAHSCLDQEIMIICDGDDWFAHEHVLQSL